MITIPAYFSDAMHDATRNAGRLAELPVLGLAREPVAAAVFCGIGAAEKMEQSLFVFDFGGGTLDTTIVQASPDGLRELATEGSGEIGGKDFDDLIMELIAKQFRARFAEDLDSGIETQQTLRRAATNIKITLTEPARAVVSKNLLLSGRTMTVTMHRKHFESAAAGLLKTMQTVCETTLRAAGFSWSSIDGVFLVGGSSLVPCVEHRVREMSRLPAQKIKCHQPHAAIAYGAALLAEQFHGRRETIAPPLRQLVTPNEIGIRVFDYTLQNRNFHPLIEKNVPIPISVQQIFYTHRSDQTTLTVEVLQRKDSYSAVESLGSFRFGPLARPEVNYPVEVRIGYTEAGRVTVTARDPRTSCTIERQFGGNDDGDLFTTMVHLRSLRLQS